MSHTVRNHLTGSVTWQSPSNIALVKYWGKHGDQLPNNPSISFTLKNSYTRTKVSFQPRTKFEGAVSLVFHFNGKENKIFGGRIEKYLTRINSSLSFLDKFQLEIESWNSFPHSAGIASSASAFSALACACQDIENKINNPGRELEWTQVSKMARLGSGSASRSVFAKAALWGKIASVDNSSDLYAIPMQSQLNEVFKTFQDSILIVSRQSKKVSSSVGHRLMQEHPYASVRYEEAKKNLQQMLDALKSGDIERAGFIIEMEAMQLHALMLCSDPNFILLQPNTLRIIEQIKGFRLDTKIPVYFTLDAGPNVHIIYPEANRYDVQNFIRTKLLSLCDQEQWIDDSVGDGPIRID